MDIDFIGSRQLNVSREIDNMDREQVILTVSLVGIWVGALLLHSRFKMVDSINDWQESLIVCSELQMDLVNRL